MSGKLYGLGVGPGDPELITLKAHRLIGEADIIAYPAPEDGDSLARSIVADFIPDGRVEYPIRMPMVVERFPAQDVYDQAAGDLLAFLRSGKNVVVLCEGDPFFYGSFMYLYERISGKAEVEVVPGVSSLTACAGRLGSPLVSRNDVLSVLPAPLSDDELKERLEATDAAAIIKLGRHFPRIHQLLCDLGLDRHSHYIERATMSNEHVLPLDQVEVQGAPYFSMILVHKRGMAWEDAEPAKAEL